MQNTYAKKFKNSWIFYTFLLLLILIVLIITNYGLEKTMKKTNNVVIICELKTGKQNSVVYEVMVDSLAEIKSVYKKKYDENQKIETIENLENSYLIGTSFSKFTYGLGENYICE